MAYYKDGVDLSDVELDMCESCGEMFDSVKLEYNETTDQYECPDCLDGYEIKTLSDVGLSTGDFVR